MGTQSFKTGRGTLYQAFLKKLFFPLITLIVLQLLNSAESNSFETGTHVWISSRAFQLYSNDELSQYKDTILQLAWQADYYDFIGSDWVFDSIIATRNHFRDVDTNSGLSGFETAYVKASDYWGRAKTAYTGGNKGSAYEFLGATAHLLSDMASPGHAHNDCHIPEICGSGDYIEEYAENNYWKWTARSDDEIPNGYSLYGLMYFLNQQTAWLN